MENENKNEQNNLNTPPQPPTSINGQPQPNEPPPTAPLNQPAPTPHSPKKKNSKKTLFIAVIVIILILGVSIVVAVLLKPKKHQVVVNKDIPVLRIGYFDGEVPNYPKDIMNNDVDINIASQMYEGLTGFQDEYKTTPLLAKSWKNINDTTWEFFLRPDVKFNDGNKLTAKDVKASLDYAVAHQNDDQNDSAYISAAAIKEVDVVNNYTVKIITTTPDALLLDNLAIIGISDSSVPQSNTLSGTGPYYIKPGTHTTDSTADLVASKTYWQGPVSVKELKIKTYSDADSILKDYKAGNLDVAGDFNTTQLASINYAKTIKVTDLGLNYLGIATEKVNSPVHNLAVRQAMAYALNVPQILKVAGLTGQQDSQIVPKTLPGYNESISSVPYQPDKAKELLSSVKNASTQITLAYPGGDDDQALEIAKELNAVGLNVKPLLVSDFSEFYNNVLAGKYDLYTLGDTTSSVDGLTLLQDLLQNNQDYTNDQINTLIDSASGTLDVHTRLQNMKDIAVIVDKDKALIPLYTQTRRYAVSKNINIAPDQPSFSNSVYYWKVSK